MRKTLLMAGAGILFLIGAGCHNSSVSPADPVQISQNKQTLTPSQSVDQNACKSSTYIPPDNGRGFSPTDCTFAGFGKQVTPKELDQASCKRISYYVIVDKNRVYKQLYDPGSSDSDQYTILKVDPANFVSLGSDYYRDAKNLYFDIGTGMRPIRGVDLDSVEVLSTHYLKDKNHVYYEGQRVEGADPATFEENDSLGGKDSHHVYKGTQIK